MDLPVVISDIITSFQSMVATNSPVGLKSSPVITNPKEFSKFDGSITIDVYRVGSAISSCG